MKKIKSFAVVFLTIIMSLSMCSCKDLDEMKKVHGVFDSEGNIVLGENTYKLLPECEELVLDYGEAVHITQPDVPVLLSTFIGKYAYITTDEKFILYAGSHIYCKADIYDEIYSQITEGYNYTNYRYGYETIDGGIRYHIFTRQEAETMNLVLELPVDLGTDFFINSVEPDYVVEIQEYTENGIFSNEICEIWQWEDTYYISYWDWDEDDLQCVGAKIPENYSGVFNVLLEDYRKATQSFREYY